MPSDETNMVKFTCFRCGIGVTLDRAAWHKRTLRDPENAKVCLDCRHFVKSEKWS